MKTALSALFLCLSLNIQAEVLNCTFTEPFIVFEYNTATQKLVESTFESEVLKTLNGVTFQIVEAGVFVLTTAEGQQLAKLKLNYEGSNGMSDTIYPYDIFYGVEGTQQIHGGCYSSLLPYVPMT